MSLAAHQALSRPPAQMSPLPTSKYASGQKHTIPARTGVAVPLPKGSSIKVTNTHGTQVVDTWAIIPPSSANPKSTPSNPTFMSRDAAQTPAYEYMSMCHSRASMLHLTPLPSDILTTNTRQPILQLIEDTTAPHCVHDTLIAACDIHRYHELGVSTHEYHDNCSDNFRGALERDVGITTFFPSPPDPLNLWMNIPVKLRTAGVGDASVARSAGGDLSFDAPVSGKGDYVVLKAVRDCVVVMSACPQDILDINCREPTEAHFEILSA